MHTPTPELEHKLFQSRDANLLQRYNWYIAADLQPWFYNYVVHKSCKEYQVINRRLNVKNP